ncbi:MAG: polyprenyl synthetase family protein, partial [Bifidobacteriaceae bacterium]|nr:polyprenyl synthetase family protein [Bifidobacteriaceae bacterium]
MSEPSPARARLRRATYPHRPWFNPADVRSLLAATVRDIAQDAIGPLRAPPGHGLTASVNPEHMAVLTSALTAAADGGKHLRARLLLTAWGTLGGADGAPCAPPDTSTVPADGVPQGRERFRGHADAPTGASPPPPPARLSYPQAVRLAAALELFQVSALIHDDIVDGADTRRGRPAAHRALGVAVAGYRPRSDAATFGRDLAILLGDLALVASERLAHEALAAAPPKVAQAILADLDQMRAEVMVGQFLDTMAPAAPLPPAEAAIDEALGIAVLKAARYSVVFPLLLGATAAGADDAGRTALEDFGAHLGLAFQLRDDILGVFGDPEAMGKSAIGDLDGAKRTVLAAIARRDLPPGRRARFEELLTSPSAPE